MRKRSHRVTATLLLARTFPGWLALIAILVILIGALPAIFAALVARLVETLPGAVEGGFASADGRRIIVTLIVIGVVLVAQELVGAAFEVVKWDWYRRYEEYLETRVMEATLAAPRLELFEDPQLAATAERAVRIAGAEPGDLVDGLCVKWMVQAQGVAATILVATVWPFAAVVLAVVWLLVGSQLQADIHRTDPYAWGNALRHAEYFRRIGGRPDWAKEVRVFGLADWLADRFGRHWAEVTDEMWRAVRIGQRTMGALLALVIVANAVMLGLATRAALDGELGLGQLTVLVQGLLGMAFLANQMGDQLIEYGTTRISELAALERAVAAQDSLPPGTRSAAGLPAREIRFEGVQFAYPGNSVPVFNELDLRIEVGKSLGIVGLNGAGKTTLIKLLAGLEIPQRGRITIDGIDLAELDPVSWRRAVAAIFQDFVHYELSARDNIGFGAVELLHAVNVDERLMSVARRTGTDTILAKLPQGLDTPLSRRFPGGVDLSGGQWQRIALARALTAVEAGARVLILDEPTAQLDVRAEADIYDRFLDLTQGLTTVVISHRFSTVRRADRIVVLDAGRISEDGGHDDLVAMGGQYARLFRKQAMRYADTESGDDDA